MNLSKFATMRGMSFGYDRTHQPIIDAMLNDPEKGQELRESLKLKRIQFDTAPQFSADLESVCNLLDCSKREFLEMAVRDAVKVAQDAYFAAFQDVTGKDFLEEYADKAGE